MFNVRTSPPNQWIDIYNNKSNGGLSLCITGQPTNRYSNVLANCVGYACSRFNEIYNIESGHKGMRFPQLCCNAEDFWTVADRIGLQKGQTPKAGAIMVWEGIGSLAGHVAIVERVNNANQVYTSESGWQSAFFWNSTRYKGSGNWGANGNYRFRGFIYNPAVVEYTWKQQWHLYDADGKMQTGWKRVNGKWYYMDTNGIMLTGWQYINGHWFYMNDKGEMQTGWQYINGKWYYFDDQGYMQTGWQKIKDKWYLLSNNGDMLTGWQKVNGKWYYLNGGNDGSMKTGWLKDKGKWYYLDPKDGYMYTGTHIIDGKTYHFDKSGALIE